MTDGTGRPGIDRDLDMIFAETEALRELASGPEEAPDGARVYDFSIRWGTLMSGRLKRLEHYYQAGELTEDQERAYRELKRELQAATPLTEHLGIGRPTVPLEVSSQEGERREGEREKALLVEKAEEVADKLRGPGTKRTRKKPAVDKGVGEPGVKKGQS
jgi:hypothetical protein